MEEREQIRQRVFRLLEAYRDGALGGETMPEQENPSLEPGSKENYLYFTLPMALNYQRNSYALWECANRLYREAPAVFDCALAASMPESELRELLVRYKVALQPNKQPLIWKTLCASFAERFQGDVRRLFASMDQKAAAIRAYIQTNKTAFPYLAGPKICNYWLYVMEQYTDASFEDREQITVAPDTHVIQASVKLGVICQAEAKSPKVQEELAARWQKLLQGTGLAPIDVHTPMWLWSRGRFAVDIGAAIGPAE